MRISNKYKLVFVSTPKAGSHTGWKIMDSNFPINNKSMHKNIVPIYAVNYNAFTFVRNPYSRAVSLWNSLLFAKNSCKTGTEFAIARKYRNTFLKYIGSDDFDKFCEYLKNKQYLNISNKFYRNFLLSQSEYHSKSNLKHITYIQLENNFIKDYILEKTGIEILETPHELKRGHSKWHELKTDKARDNIIRWAEKDFESYGYDIDY